MEDNKLVDIVKSQILTIFSSIYLVDIASDKVYIYDNSKLVVLSFFEFVQYLTPRVSSSQLNEFFSNLSVKKLEDNNGSISFKYKSKEENDFVDLVSFIKLINEEGKQLILVMNKIEDNNTSLVIGKDSVLLQSKLNAMSNKVSDIILKIYNTLDSVGEKNSTNNYIRDLLGQLIREFPEFKSELEKEMISQVNKGKDTLLIVDDDAMTRNLLKKTFNEDYEIVMANNGQEAIDILEKQFINNETTSISNIAGIFLDILMPVMDGFSVLDYLREKNLLSRFPIIIISATEDKETRQRVYQYNIADLLEKPFNLEIIKYRTKNLISLYKTSNSLNSLISSQQLDLMSVVKTLVNSYIIDNKDKIQRIKQYTELLAREVVVNYPEYKLSEFHIKTLVSYVDLYDVGLYILPKTVLKKHDLSDSDKKLINTHTILGNKIVSRVVNTVDTTTRKIISDVVLYHHEKYDGSGYPKALVGDNIPIVAQIVSLAIEIDKVKTNSVDVEQGLSALIYQNTKYNPKLLLILQKIMNDIK